MESTAAPSCTLVREKDGLTLLLRGDWRLERALPEAALEMPADAAWRRLILRDDGIEGWDSMLMLFVLRCRRWSEGQGLELDISGLPPAAARLLTLATAVPAPAAVPPPQRLPSFTFHRDLAHALGAGSRDFVEFLGAFFHAFARLLAGRATLRGKDLVYHLFQAGPKGLGIITLVSILVGMILAYLGSVQLRQLGAQIFVADLVAIGMSREMGGLMTAVILAGRTGAAYAAQIGTMQVNEETAALRTMGLSAMEFLVLPRMLALLLVLPLLSIYAVVLGMLGGAIVATSLDVNWPQYLIQSQGAIGAADLLTGLLKSLFFALLIGMAGCQAGLQCGRDANAVGLATTSAVVRALVYLIVADALFNILYDNLGI